MLSRRIPDLGRKNAWSTRLETLRLDGRAPSIDLTEANPTRVGLSALGADEGEALALAATARYEPDARGLPSARAAVSHYYRDRGVIVPPDQVILASGTSEAYAHLFRLLCDPGDSVLVPQPSYPLFEPLLALEGVRAIGYRLEWHGRWRIDFDQLGAAADDGARAIIVVQPNHPTGSCLDPEDRIALEDFAVARGLAIVSDEVFADFPWPGHDASIPSLLGDSRALTFALGGLSKVCGLPQLKLSWIAVSGPGRARDEALAGLGWIADLFLSVASPVQAALPALLGARHVFQARARERIGANLGSLAALVRRRPEIQTLEAQGGWVAVLRLPSRRSDEEWALELLNREVVVHAGHFYDFAEPWYLVISLIVEPQTMAEGLSRIEALVAEA